jgi:hypothetical protein
MPLAEALIEFRQSGDELRRKFLDRIEEAKPQIFFAHMRQQIANQPIVTWSDRPDKYPPEIPENDMPLPLRRIRADGGCQFRYLAWRSFYASNRRQGTFAGLQESDLLRH